MNNNSKQWTPHGLIAVLHLPAMPGDPKYQNKTTREILDFALKDAKNIVEGGINALIIENFGSAPFPKGNAAQPVPPQHIALMAILAHELRTAYPELIIGINCLRNDAKAAMGIAKITSANFIRVNVLSNTYCTDQGVIEGEAYELLRFKKLLDAEKISIAADILVKHANPLATLSPREATKDTLDRALANAVIVTGNGTGMPVDRKTLEEVFHAAESKPVLMGSGTKIDTLPIYAPFIQGAIVGTSLKFNAQIENHVDIDRVKNLVTTFKQLVKPII